MAKHGKRETAEIALAKAEAKKLRAEANKLDAEAEQIRAELSGKIRRVGFGG